MVNAFFYSNVAQPATLSGNITNAATSATVSTTVGWPSSFPYIVAIDFGAASEELVKVTANAAGTLTIERAYGGTTAVSHSIGAVVRHVFNAQDATDFRTHEQATAAVHGVTGTLVGTSDTQSLSNKTLTSPTINGGVMTGTFTGGPTFSGSSVLFQRPGTADPTIRSTATGDSQDRFRIASDGTLAWGSGAAAQDVHVYRGAPNMLTVTDLVEAVRTNTTDLSFRARTDPDTQPRWRVLAGGELTWSDGSALPDTNLYRSAASTLKTDDNLDVAGSLSVTGNLSVTGLGREIIVYKTANTARSSTTARTADPHLSVSLPANSTWVMNGYLKYGAATAGDFAMGFDAPGDIALMSWAFHMPDPSATSEPTTVRVIETNTTGARVFGGITTPIPIAGTIVGAFEAGPTGGTVAISWAQGTSDAAATTLYQGSWLRFRRIA